MKFNKKTFLTLGSVFALSTALAVAVSCSNTEDTTTKDTDPEVTTTTAAAITTALTTNYPLTGTNAFALTVADLQSATAKWNSSVSSDDESAVKELLTNWLGDKFATAIKYATITKVSVEGTSTLTTAKLNLTVDVSDQKDLTLFTNVTAVKSRPLTLAELKTNVEASTYNWAYVDSNNQTITNPVLESAESKVTYINDDLLKSLC